MSETATEDMHTETPAVEGAPTEIAEAPMESTEAPAEETEKNTVPVDPNAGKYSWSGDGEKSVKAAGDVLGAKISDYAWGDGEKKATVYVTLDGLDDLPDEAIDLKLVGPREVSMTVAFPSIMRMLELKRTYGEVDSVKSIRKKGKNQVVIKLVKKTPSPWYNLLSAAGGNDYDLSDDDDYEEPADNDIELGGDDGGAEVDMTDSAAADLANEGDMADDAFEEDGADVTSASTD